MQATNPYKYLELVSELFDTLNSREEINQVIDELEYLYDLIDPEFQDQVSDLINRLTKRLQELD
jgi:predicted metallopeptidase